MTRDVEFVTCPAGVCGLEVAIHDPDRMFGHLLRDHRWTFDTAQDAVLSLYPEDDR